MCGELLSWSSPTLQVGGIGLMVAEAQDRNSVPPQQHPTHYIHPQRLKALVAHVLQRYKIDIAVLSETRFHGEDSLTEVGEGYNFFWRVS
jgi:hypothetical protein